MWIVYTEIHSENGVERWYYGTWDDHNRANEVAITLGNNYPVFHCVCSKDQVEELGIKRSWAIREGIPLDRPVFYRKNDDWVPGKLEIEDGIIEFVEEI